MRHPFYTAWTTWKYFVSQMVTRNDCLLWRCRTSQVTPGFPPPQAMPAALSQAQLPPKEYYTLCNQALCKLLITSKQPEQPSLHTQLVPAVMKTASKWKRVYLLYVWLISAEVYGNTFSLQTKHMHPLSLFNLERGCQFHTNFSTGDMTAWTKWQFLIMLKRSWQNGSSK